MRPLSPGWPPADPSADPPASAAWAGSAAGAFSHQLGAADVLALAGCLYGHWPVALLVSVGAASLEPGVGLSAAVRRAIPHAARVVLAAIDAAPLMSGGPQAAPGAWRPAGPAAGPLGAAERTPCLASRDLRL